jgi:SRSO17 transposase
MVTVAATVGIPVSEIMGVTRHTSVATLYGNTGKARLRPEQWLLVEWPASDAEPSKYFLSTLPEDTPINELVGVAHQRWRIERDYQDLKQDLGLGHYEGRG